MSAFLFCKSDKAIKEATEEQLKEHLVYWHSIVDDLDWSQFQMCTFKWDQASGFMSNITRAEAELEARKNGKHFEGRVLVPGFNPPPEDS